MKPAGTNLVPFFQSTKMLCGPVEHKAAISGRAVSEAAHRYLRFVGALPFYGLR